MLRHNESTDGLLLYRRDIRDFNAIDIGIGYANRSAPSSVHELAWRECRSEAARKDYRRESEDQREEERKQPSRCGGSEKHVAPDQGGRASYQRPGGDERLVRTVAFRTSHAGTMRTCLGVCNGWNAIQSAH
jgi:hypothetical protein